MRSGSGGCGPAGLETIASTALPTSRALEVTVDSDGAYLTALSRRLSRIWCRRSGSAATGGMSAGTSDAPADIPPVAADPERLHQILDNLLDNAVKYAPSESTVTSSARLVGSAVEAIVSNPAGPHPPDPDRMFERFYRADPSRSAAAGGVGLGLAISRELASAMGGRLWADIDGSGNLRMHLTLPAAKGRQTEPVPPPASASAA